ncbi:MAG: helix-turn-helix domain-containing protein [Clostridiales bacterium]|nr:helix-turn-helix domain-containing protein [Clostridiales bacterium]
MPKRKCAEVNFTIGQRLKKYRNACDLTQQQVADLLNINRTTYTKYETGVSEPSQDLLRKIVALFGTDFNAILGDEDTFEEDVYDSRLPMYALTNKEKELVASYRLLPADQKKSLYDTTKQMLAERTKKN